MKTFGIGRRSLKTLAVSASLAGLLGGCLPSIVTNIANFRAPAPRPGGMAANEPILSAGAVRLGCKPIVTVDGGNRPVALRIECGADPQRVIELYQNNADNRDDFGWKCGTWPSTKVTKEQCQGWVAEIMAAGEAPAN
jgi:hypothetical protein